MSATKRKGKLNTWRVVLLVGLLCCFVGVGTAAGFVAGVVKDLPAVSELDPAKQQMETSFILNEDGSQVVARLHGEENRVLIDIDELPEHLLNAFIAIEDKHFWSHPGIDVTGIIRATFKILTGGGLQSGSTITQQLAKEAFLTQEQTIRRKVADMILAIQLERRYTKKEILEFYLNQIYLGPGVNGVETASQYYFGKSARDVSFSEAALLAGLTQNPGRYSPFNNPEAATNRRNYVLTRMEELEMISPQEAEAARQEGLNLNKEGLASRYQAPYFVDYVLEQLLDRYGKDLVYGGGLRVFTSIDLDIQQAAEAAVAKHLNAAYPLTAEKAQPEMAVVVLDHRTGHIKAMVGGREHKRMLSHNRAVHSLRQPGSAFKPIAVYAPALDLGYTAASVIDDYPTTYVVAGGSQTWTPRNYDNTYRGLITTREAVEGSVNVVAVKLLDMIGIRTGLQYAEKFGINSMVATGPQSDFGLALALGGLTKGVSVLELTSAFGVFPNQGIRVEPVAILRVVDKDGNVLEDNTTARKEVVLKPEVAYLMTSILESTVKNGTGRGADFGYPAGGKTGTTSDCVDAWFVGFTPHLVAGIWMGYDQPQAMVNPLTGGPVWGSSFCVPVWREIMANAHANLPVQQFPQANNIVTLPVCTKSGKLPSSCCPPEQIRTEVFIRGTEPTTECETHLRAWVCSETGELATARCPAPMEKVFIQREVPWVPITDHRGVAVKPLDAVQELPVITCATHQHSVPVIRDDDDDDRDHHGPTQPSGPKPTDNAQVVVDGNNVLPDHIVARANHRLTIQVTAHVAHRLLIPDFDIDRSIRAGTLATVRFTPDKVGTFPFQILISDEDGEKTISGVLEIKK